MGSGASVEESAWRKQLEVVSTEELKEGIEALSPDIKARLLDALTLAAVGAAKETVEILCKKGKKMRIADALVGPFRLTMANEEDRDAVDDDSSPECYPLLAVTQKDDEIYRFRHVARQKTLDMDSYFMISWDVGQKEPETTRNGSKESLREDLMWCSDPAFVLGLQRLELNASPALAKMCPRDFDTFSKEAQAEWWKEQEKMSYIKMKNVASFLPMLNSDCPKLQVLELDFRWIGLSDDAAIAIGGNGRGIGKDGRKESGLAAMENLRRLGLDLAENRIGDEGVAALGAGIHLLHNLESLFIGMSANFIQNTGATAICMHVASLSKVNSLSLNFHDNDIDDNGAIECCKQFQSRGQDAVKLQMALVMTNCKITGGAGGTETKDRCIEVLKDVPNFNIRVEAGPRDPTPGNAWCLSLPP